MKILNGPQTQELKNIGDSLGQEWCREITGRMGLFFNCHSGREHDFQYLCLIPMNRHAIPIQDQLS